MSKAKIVELNDSNVCKLCENALAKYSCPKCNILYCSLSCYRSGSHLQCSEQFYKSCIEEELSSTTAPDEIKKKMMDMLERNRLEEGEDDADLDSDDNDDVVDIAERLAGIDLDNADEIWDKLTQDEQQDFVAFLKSKDVTKLIPSWKPWWLHSAKPVEEVGSCNSFKMQCPPLVKIANFQEMSKKPPADCVKYNLMNVLAAYAFTTRYFNGEYTDFGKEAATCLISISLSLKLNHNFDAFDSAVASVEHECTESEWIVADSENYAMLRDDLTKILQGPSSSEPKLYILSGLSDLHHLLSTSLSSKKKKSTFAEKFPDNQFPDVKLESKTKIKACIRKVEYLLSYSKDCLIL